MSWFIYLFGIVWIAGGSLLILYTDQCRETMAGVLRRVGRVPVAATAAMIGLLLMVSAGGRTHAGVLLLIGLLAVVKGVVFFWNPRQIYEKARRWWIEECGDQTHRLTGIIMLVLGTALISWA